MKNRIILLSLTICAGMFLFSCNSNDPDLPPDNTPRKQSKSTKRGVSYNFAGYPDEDMALLSPGVTWFYNWGSKLSSIIDYSAGFYDLTFFPMAWKDINEAEIRAYKALHPECRYLLAYNEPNLTDQANMTPREAAEKWPRLLALAKELELEIVSPAMNYGTLPNYGDPIVWLDEFFSLIDSNDIYAISIHCYMGSTSALKSYVERFKKYGKPIWMTEFCAWENNITSPEAQMKFMSEAVCYMELDPDVERYAWFIPKGGGLAEVYPYMFLIDKNYPPQLTECGEVYVNMSTLDKKVYAEAGQQIEAEHYTNCNLSESIGQKGYSIPVHIRPTTDTEGGLDIYDFTENKWVEYQIQSTKKHNYDFSIRYQSGLDTEMTIYLNGNIADFVSLPESGSWNTCTTSLTIPEGKHTIRLEVTEGNTGINWIKFQ